VITYVDTSTLIKLIIDEEGSDRAELIWQSADSVASVSLVVVEARAALVAAVRGDRLSSEQLQLAKTELAAFVDDLHFVDVTENLVDSAARLAESESLRGYVAVHLASALLVNAAVLTSADRDLCEAAERQGLHIANPLHR
jgi:predicted nucleic acid-binding protein